MAEYDVVNTLDLHENLAFAHELQIDNFYKPYSYSYNKSDNYVNVSHVNTSNNLNITKRKVPKLCQHSFSRANHCAMLCKPLLQLYTLTLH